MNRTLLGLAVMVAALGATVSRADDDDCGARPHFAVQGGASREQGQYQLQTRQIWVPGTQQQVWVPGQCNRYGCSPGGYQYVTGPGHYENHQEWVWVAYQVQPRQQYEYGQRAEYGRRWGRHGAVSVGFR